MSDWYSRLTDYFPEKEMKSKKHFEILFHEKQGIYQLEESTDYVIVYFEMSDCIFIDYILVTRNNRGNGRGSKILDQLKRKGKTIILEVEPVTILDPDSDKRIRFYEKNSFLKMNSIRYERIHMVTNELNKMDIFCWTPVHRTEEWVYDRMKAIYDDVHAFKASELYGRNPQPVSDVLWIRELTYSKA
ncbi:GNAT family N-acetyltransferase [Bacillus sp. ISL-40]|uniref:GNAT family N-acetyltransferase n=1 Tax=unclassified Bacillus (in: firmicutes) TaxID=185979 RepID=UPI001BEBB03C|nr:MULTISPECIES: GNAT family N-acetyltransferase [unclassified Bacillus (in: firmicutes)]MBT2699941.1 GNAT family N-acetyltransferase [Bacillus sp. ISL-40]MBT2722960.1 GNAT family N-acetyltransferase [Bacillus sp. ISL-46]MBT2743754.1 GNAT family N-acetyltransferase [Bacillus sp. ISL-77]